MASGVRVFVETMPFTVTLSMGHTMKCLGVDGQRSVGSEKYTVTKVAPNHAITYRVFGSDFQTVLKTIRMYWCHILPPLGMFLQHLLNFGGEIRIYVP